MQTAHPGIRHLETSPPLQRGRGHFQTFDACRLALAVPNKQNLQQPQAEPVVSVQRGKNLAIAGGLLLSALVLRGLPARPGSFKWLSTDWKDWAKLGLGVAGLNKIHEAMDWKPPSWLMAMETVAIVNPLMMGFKKTALVQMLAMAPVIGLLVQGTHWASDKAEEPLEDKGIPKMLTRLAISAGMILLGLKALPQLIKLVTTAGVEGRLGKTLAGEFKQLVAKQEAMAQQGRTLMTGAELVCVRCGGSHALCMSEIADYLGALGGWLHLKKKKDEPS